MSRSSRRETRSTSNSRERWKVVNPRIGEKNMPSRSSEVRGAPPLRRMIRLTSRLNPTSRSARRGSAGSVMIAVVALAKISASGARS